MRQLHSILLTVACLLPLAAGCTRTINRSAERKIRDALPDYIGTAKVWRAHVENPAERTIRGQLAHVTIDGEGVALKQTIVCESLHIEMRNVEVDAGKQRLKSVQETLFTAVISESGLNDYIRSTPPPDDEPTRIRVVRLRDGQMVAYAARRLIGREWEYSVTVEPRLASPTKLEFSPDRMTVLGLKVPLPQSVLRWFARRLDKGFDFSTLPFPVRITQFKVDQGRITLSGTADVMPSLNERIAKGQFNLQGDRGSVADTFADRF